MKFEDLPAFEGPGKTYHGIRYPDGTIRPPHCQVMVIPEDGQPYELEKCHKLKYIGADFDWGCVLGKLGKTQEPIVWQKSIYEKKAVFHRKVRERSEAGWKKIELHQKRCHQLALAILADFYKPEFAIKCYERLSGSIIEKLPEAEWKLTAKQIDDVVGCEIVLAAMEGIK